MVMQYDDDDRPAKGKYTVVFSVLFTDSDTFPNVLTIGRKTAETPLNCDKLN